MYREDLDRSRNVYESLAVRNIPERLVVSKPNAGSRRSGRGCGTYGDQTTNADLTHEEVRHRPYNMSGTA